MFNKFCFGPSNKKQHGKKQGRAHVNCGLPRQDHKDSGPSNWPPFVLNAELQDAELRGCWPQS